VNEHLRAYALPGGASRLDRATLAVWRGWDTWIRPTLLASFLMIAGHLLIALISGAGSSGGPSDFRQWRFLVKWGANPPPLTGTLISPFVLHSWSIGSQAAAALVGAFAAWPVLKRHPRPALLGAAAGLAATVVHLWAAHLFTLAPLGYHGYAAVASVGCQTVVYPLCQPEHSVIASTPTNLLAVAALWSPVLFGGAVGSWVGRRRRRAATSS
jgi:hypothetical protein